jgi:hypothetical protein
MNTHAHTCTHMHTHVHTCTHTHTHTHTYSFDRVDENGDLPPELAEPPPPASVQKALDESQKAAEERAANSRPIYSSLDAGLYVCMYVYIYIYTCSGCMRFYMYIHPVYIICTQYTHTYTYTYMHTHVHTHVDVITYM